MKSANDLAAKVVSEPETVSTLSQKDTREVLAKLLIATGTVVEKWLCDDEPQSGGKSRDDRLLNMKELASRMGCSKATLARGRKSGQYPFILKDGGRLVGSEAGLERWIKSRTDRKFSRN